jgi:hypothetical protein
MEPPIEVETGRLALTAALGAGRPYWGRAFARPTRAMRVAVVYFILVMSKRDGRIVV